MAKPGPVWNSCFSAEAPEQKHWPTSARHRCLAVLFALPLPPPLLISRLEKCICGSPPVFALFILPGRELDFALTKPQTWIYGKRAKVQNEISIVISWCDLRPLRAFKVGGSTTSASVQQPTGQQRLCHFIVSVVFTNRTGKLRPEQKAARLWCSIQVCVSSRHTSACPTIVYVTGLLIPEKLHQCVEQLGRCRDAGCSALQWQNLNIPVKGSAASSVLPAAVINRNVSGIDSPENQVTLKQKDMGGKVGMFFCSSFCFKYDNYPLKKKKQLLTFSSMFGKCQSRGNLQTVSQGDQKKNKNPATSHCLQIMKHILSRGAFAVSFGS